EMDAWQGELARLDERVVVLRDSAGSVESAIGDAEAARDAAHGRRAAAEGQRSELARLVATQRQQVQEIRGEMAGAEERQRNAGHRRQRAELEANEGEALGERIETDRQNAATDRQRFENELQTAQAALTERQREENDARQAVSAARATLEGAERQHRELQDRA